MLSFFKPQILKCSVCNQVIKEKEQFTVTLTLPSEAMMPVGILDKVLAKHAAEVICSGCK
ncbi:MULTISPECIES: hypothetical protein [unclassified Paenibacillus]|uniref:hypothetical protein n=1 Tax=unclassified Paenibacillus TaxID=185978 RepID=UPI002F423EA4